MKASIKDVAKLAGVSQACVSKFLNNKPYVSKKTKEKIQKAIDELNYRPSAIARSLVTKKSKNIGIIVLDITNPYQTETIRGIEEYKTIHNLDYNILLIDMATKEGSGDKYIDVLLENRVAGIATTSDKISPQYVRFLNKISIPTIFIGRVVDVPEIEIDFVTVDNEKGAYGMTNYLLGLGHRKIFYFTGPLDTNVTSQRLKGYKKALREFEGGRLKPEVIDSGDFTYEAGYKTAEQIFSSTNRPSAIFCANDYSAFGVIDYCYKHGVKIPDDVSVAGFDDVAFSSFGFISLTTVRQPIKKLGILAAESLFKKIIDGTEEPIQIVLKPEIVIRRSTKTLK
ncbi:MAG: LacI family DNA-binding transcriptional regulator [Candidatus Humimicrobiaceae bacterium]